MTLTWGELTAIGAVLANVCTIGFVFYQWLRMRTHDAAALTDRVNRLEQRVFPSCGEDHDRLGTIETKISVFWSLVERHMAKLLPGVETHD